MRHLVFSLLFILLSTLLGFTPGCQARQLVIFKSKDYLSRSYEIQRFVDTLSMPVGDQSLPITMTLYNGSPEAPSYKWFRIIVNGQVLASEQDMRGAESASKDLSGLIRGADLQVQVEAGGVPGASLWWTLSIPQIELSYAEPQQVSPGQTLKLLGSNFPSDPGMITVFLNSKQVRAGSASSNTVQITVPENADTGVNRVQLSAGGVMSNPISTTVLFRPVPEILGTDCWMAPPGGTINISGRNFSANPAGNKVFFGEVQAQISDSSATQLTVIVPNWSYGPSQLNIPISVESNGVRSANTFPFDIGPSYHGAVPQFGHD